MSCFVTAYVEKCLPLGYVNSSPVWIIALQFCLKTRGSFKHIILYK